MAVCLEFGHDLIVPARSIRHPLNTTRRTPSNDPIICSLRVAKIFPDRPAVTRLVGEILAEQHDEGADCRRYLGLDLVTRRRTATDPTPTPRSRPTYKSSPPGPPARDHASYTHLTGLGLRLAPYVETRAGASRSA
jgi:hypothetical protein